MRLSILCPHIWPDTAPTGDVMRLLLERWAGEGHECHVVTTLPWYRDHRVEQKWRGVAWHRQVTDWGSVLRLHPCALPAIGGRALAKPAKSNLVLRAAGFAAFGAYAATAGLAALAPSDIVFAMSPPLTLAAAASAVATVRRTPLVLNLQDLHPDAAIATQAVTNKSAIAAARWLEKLSYQAASAIVVLSQQTRAAVLERSPAGKHVEVIPNFADTVKIKPGPRNNEYRRQLGIGEDVLVFMYAGNVGFSQPLGLVKAAATQLAERRDICFVINGGGAAMSEVRSWAATRPNVIISDYQPAERLSEVLAAADVHLVLLGAGLGHVSVPSKVYAAFSAARPVLAAAEKDSEISRIITTAAAGVTVDPTDEAGFRAAVTRLADDRQALSDMGTAAANSAQLHSPDVAAASYLALFERLAAGQ